MGSSTTLPSDGRIQRSERSRTAIVDAMLELIGEGSIAPTAQQVAERADVGVRTVFRHFSDMDTLFATMNSQIRAEVQSLFVEEIQTGALEERIDSLIERRLEIFGTLAPYLRSGRGQRARSTFLQEEHERTIRVLRNDLRRWLPEVEDLASERVEALDLLLSFESLDRMRVDQRLSVRRTAAVLRSALLTLTKPETTPS